MIPSPLLLGLVLLVDPRAKHVDFSGGAAFEVRGGLAPPQPGSDPEPVLRLSVSPQASLTYRDRVRNRRFTLEYTPRVFVVLSETLLASSQVPGRPLLFHQLLSRFSGDFNSRWSWSGSVGASLGEQDYSLQSGSLVQGDGSTSEAGVDSEVQPTQAGLLDQPIIVNGGISGGVGLVAQLAPTHSISIGPSVSVLRLISDQPTVEDGQAPISLDQTSYEMTLGYSWIASRVDRLGAVVTGGYADFGASNGTQAFTSATLDWRHRLRPRLDSELIGGVFFTQQVQSPTSGTGAVTDSDAVPLMPVGNAILIGRVLERAKLRITADVNVGSQAYFDPVRGSVLPLSGGGVGLGVQLPPDWTMGVVSSFYTPPVAPTEEDRRQAGDPGSTRTTLSVTTPVTYVIDRNTTLEFGTITTARGPNLGTGLPDPDQLLPFQIGEEGMPTDQRHNVQTIPFEQIRFTPWRFTQAEVWLYVSVQFDYTTLRSP